MTYEIKFTHAAEVQAAARGLDLKELSAFIRGDLADCGCDDVMDLVFHTAEKPRETYWFCTPTDAGYMLVDSAVYETIETPQGGNFAKGGVFEGMKIAMPRPETDD